MIMFWQVIPAILGVAVVFKKVFGCDVGWHSPRYDEKGNRRCERCGKPLPIEGRG
jgi:hypothetical protein